MLGLDPDRLRADMNRLLALLFHQVILIIVRNLDFCFLCFVVLVAAAESLLLQMIIKCRECWMSSSCNCSNFKMRAPLTLFLKLSTFTSMNQRSFWGISDRYCNLLLQFCSKLSFLLESIFISCYNLSLLNIMLFQSAKWNKHIIRNSSVPPG